MAACECNGLSVGRDEHVDPEDDNEDDAKKSPDAVENLMKALGVLGRYQLIQIVIVCFSSTLFVFVMLNFVFIGYEPDHKCHKVNETDLLERFSLLNDSSADVKYDTCAITVTFNRTGTQTKVVSLDCYGGYDYVGHKYMSMVSEWDLVCDKSGVVGLLQTVFTLGLGLGVVLFTSIADRYGRKYVFMFDVAATIATEVSLVFAPNIYSAIAIRFFSGFTVGGMCLLHCVIESELIITKYRQVFWAVDCIWFSANVMLLSGLGYLLQDVSWRYLQLAAPISGVHTVIAAFALNETPVWCFAKGRYDNAQRIVMKACRINKKNVENVMEKFRLCIKEAKVKSTAPPTYTLIDVLRNKYILVIVLISGYLWFTCSLAYYGLYLTSSTLAGNRFLNFFLMAMLEIPSAFVCMTVVVYLGRRTVVMLFTAISAVALLVSACLVATGSSDPKIAYTSTAFFLLGKFAVGSSFNVGSAYTQELLVTTIRSAGTGVSAMFARVGGMIAPFLLPLFHAVAWAPGAILAALCVICLILLPILPESKGRQLPDTFEEIMEWRKTTGKGEKVRC